MARNDGVDRTSVRNLAVSDKAVGNTQQHNEREKDSYRNPDIIPQRTAWNVHFKKPTASYTDLFAQLEAAGTISTRGLKPDAIHYCELVFDVNSAYFDNHGGYEFAKQFYEDAYKAAVQIVGGEQYILSAVMHADEINRAMTEALGREVYHYHLHVVYVPVVEKQILWSKRCKDKALVGTCQRRLVSTSCGHLFSQLEGQPAEAGCRSHYCELGTVRLQFAMQFRMRSLGICWHYTMLESPSCKRTANQS